jgi:hypothetical protein
LGQSKQTLSILKMIKQSWLSMNFWLNVLIFSFFLVPFSYGIQNKLIKRVGNVFGPGVDVLNNKKIHVTTNKSNAINGKRHV